MSLREPYWDQHYLMLCALMDMDDVTECSLSKFCRWHQASGAVDSLEGRDVFQRNLDKIRVWAHINLIVSWISAKPNIRCCSWDKKITNISKRWGIKALREALQRRIWRYWYMENWTWAIKMWFQSNCICFQRSMASRSGEVILPLPFSVVRHHLQCCI